MLVAITGTPGVGKTTVSEILRKKYKVIDIHSYAEEHGLFESFDEEAGSYIVDTDRLNDSILSEKFDGTVFLDGHLSHFVDCDKIIVLRCEPHIIQERLKHRGYDDKKILENVQTEVLDIILAESMESGIDTYEIDCTGLGPEHIASKIEIITNGGDTEDVSPGNVDWSGEMEEWF